MVSRCIDKFESVKTVIFMEGSYFGETDIIMKRGRTESAYAETDVELWKLDRKDFIEALKAFKDIRKEVEKLVYEKVNARGSSSPTFKGVMKYLLPASYFISRISKSKKLLKSNIQNILRKSGKVLNELKVIGEKKDQYHDIRKLFLMDNSKKRKDKNEISECSIEQIEELGLKETVIFLKNQKIDILEEEFILMMKLPQQLQSFKDNLLRTTAHIDHPKIESMVKVLKFLNSVLKVQEEELVIEYKLLKKED